MYELYFQGRLHRGAAYFVPMHSAHLERILACFDGADKEALEQALGVLRDIPQYPRERYGPYLKGVFFSIDEATARITKNLQRAFIPFLLVARPELLLTYSDLLATAELDSVVALMASSEEFAPS